jgi:hypothetical protein
MTTRKTSEVQFADEADEQDVAEQLPRGATAASVSGTDWTTETIVSQLQRENIQLNPRFQRRDAWARDRKSRFIESLILGLPIPQIVLAESRDDRGKFIVIDGSSDCCPFSSFGVSAKAKTTRMRLRRSRCVRI